MRQTIITITAYQFLLLAFILFFYKSDKKKCNRILAFFLFFKGLALASFLIKPGSISYNRYLLLVRPIFTLYIPFVWFYVISVINPDFRLRFKKHFWHFLPTALCIVVLSFRAFLDHRGVSSPWLEARNVSRGLSYLYYVQTVSYLLYSILFIGRKNKNFFSNLQLAWLRNLLLGLLLIWGVFLVRFLFRVFSVESELMVYFYDFSLVLLFVLVNMMVFYAVKEPRLFFDPTSAPSKVSGYALDQAKVEKHAKLIRDTLVAKKSYIHPDFNLDMLARDLNLNPRVVSKVINTKYHKNFYDYVNSYRIEDAKTLLSDPTNNQTILEILYQVGFNSKSVFNTYFKKKTGLTPTQYRQKYRELTPC